MSLLNILRFIKYKIIKTNLFVFFLISIFMTLLAERLPMWLYYYKNWMYKERKWEDGGRIYERLFFVRKWKCRLPEISEFLKWRFSKKHLTEKNNPAYLTKFLVESCKSEFTHWMIILSTILFIFWSDLYTMSRTMMLALILNIPYIIIQRYNRPRIIKLIQKNDVEHYELSPVKA
ncbi:MAG TPA: hypothetical protein VHR42_03240 [Clostridia bacterium]|nr:hypothetical protein [Clostridia bacterium]